eukprot:gb/GFBE01039357.1/.p1 GENE.gb/GFBE01039357.1/~~gb/GFBE01039357.1/.p1  ORF type:complete len:299 (+),score=72.24 gb/GFBE01039357.1/:1-897(+)
MAATLTRSQPGLTSLARTLERLEKDKSRVKLSMESSSASLKVLITKEPSSMQEPLSPPVSPRIAGSGFEFTVTATDESGRELSYWHDLPLYPVDSQGQEISYHVNFINEIPRCTRKKYEVSTKVDSNPIKQDVKKGVLREYSKGDIYFNYGCVPRTWEDPTFVHPDVGVGGDGDPLDACEIGLRIIPTGELRVTKVLGVICMIDEDEADWKLIVIDVQDPWAKDLHDIADVEEKLPGTLDQIREWWRTYKVPDGKPLNKFGLDEKFMDRSYAMEVIADAHEAWKSKYGDKALSPAKAG